ncbi:MAG: diaminopimelate epimerase [Phycisphaerae bacterium]|nr:MAG: diaminopimelate epimerase [Phycisphaerae bacterium]
MRYTQMHGCGNSFYVVDARDGQFEDQDALSVLRRHCGDPFDLDGLVMVHQSTIADVKTVIYNSDGSRAPMCGNGVRCLSKYVVDHTPETSSPVFEQYPIGGLARLLATPNGEIPAQVRRVLLASIIQTDWAVEDRVSLFRMTAETDSGIKTHYCVSRGGKVIWATVSLGRPETRLARLNCTLEGEEACDREINFDGRCFRASVIGLGNLHCVVFVDDLERVAVEKEGRLIERCTDIFPDSVNVHFVRRLSRNHLQIKTWERGAGATLACGTGSCASVVAGMRTGRCESRCRVDQPGGTIYVDVDEDVLMSGPAIEVERGDWSE